MAIELPRRTGGLSAGASLHLSVFSRRQAQLCCPLLLLEAPRVLSIAAAWIQQMARSRTNSSARISAEAIRVGELEMKIDLKIAIA